MVHIVVLIETFSLMVSIEFFFQQGPTYFVDLNIIKLYIIQQIKPCKLVIYSLK